MVKIIIKSTILFVPILLVIGICIAVGLNVGEIYSFNYITRLQSDNREIKYSIIGSRWDHFSYKSTAINLQQPKLVLLSSSRGWHFRDYISNKNPHYFYNASVIHASINELQPMVEEFVQMDNKPEVILLSLDYPDYNADSNFRERSRQLKLVTYQEHVADAIKRSILHVLGNPSTILRIFDSQPTQELGWNFVTEDDPDYYRGDGSYSTNYFTNGVLEQELPKYMNLIANGEEQFQYGSAVDETSLESLTNILRLATENDIDVIGFFPPYHTEILAKLKNNDRYSYMPLAWSSIQQVFEQYGLTVYDFSDVRSFGGDDNGMYDGWHPGELMSTEIYLQLLRNKPEILSEYSDIDYLVTIIQSATDTYHPSLFMMN